MSKNIKTYITYFDDNQIEEYNLKSDDNTMLFKGNDTSYSGETINNLNTFYCELCTMYYIWKNNMKSDYVVLKQYRRLFDWESVGKLPKEGEVICYEYIIMRDPVIQQYAICHGYKRAEDIFSIITNKVGSSSNEMRYFLTSHMMFTNNTMVLCWDDFCRMCEFVFGITEEIDKTYRLEHDHSKYMENAQAYTEDGRYDYQTHWMAYIGERLVSCYIATHLKPLMIKRLEGNGFYKPYQKKE